MNGAFYNDIDPKACAWLRELIAGGHIAPGTVDNRSIADIDPGELREFTQVHFFAGIGGWSLALRWAGWPDDRPVWTGSCPCQPLSCAGQRKGHADERHLWPAFYSLIAECQPPVVFGEQVASKDGREWLAGVRADLEGIGYALGAADLCAAGVGAPHRRQRLFWAGALVNAHGARQREQRRAVAVREKHTPAECAGSAFGLADAAGGQCEQRLWPCGDAIQQPADHGATGGLGDTEHHGLPADPQRRGAGQVEGESGLREPQGPNPGWPGWGRFETIYCRDGKTRRFEPGSFPLAHGIPGRVGLLRGYGNAIVPQVAAEFINAFQKTKF
ncbi:MAG: DNA cytosine methyltransferase [Verrucomicrobia bacterium]|nr:DNA cytosine methyltransferase [Verrucomicrobiota bacterium]